MKNLLNTLGEDLTEEEVEAAFAELNNDHSGSIAFDQFVEWFTAEDDVDFAH